MSIIRWRRRQDLPSLFEHMNAMLGDMIPEGVDPTQLWQRATGETGLAVDMYETETEVVVRAELPGVARDSIEVNAEKSTIGIRAEAKREEECEQAGYYRRELRYGTFSRTLPTPTDIKPDEVSAKFEDGMLTIRAPKAEEEQAGHKVQVE